MNKTITSNIAGIVFHIDENAFQKLEQYLKNIRNYFSGSEGEEDIVSGIEERIAEMLQAKVKGGKTIITLSEVDEVIAIMGQPEAFDVEDDEDENVQSGTSIPKAKTSKRLFRDADSRIVGGVCSGISHYLGINEPIWLRLAFLLSFIFAGSGLLLYIILWVIIPKASTPSEKLEMKGENVTVENIGKTVNAEMESLRKKWDDSSVGGNQGVRKVGDFVMKALTLVANIALSFVKFIAKFIGLIFLMVGIFCFMVIAGISLGLPAAVSLSSEGVVTSGAMSGLLVNILGGPMNTLFAKIALLLLAGIPLLGIAFLGVKLLFNFRGGSKWVALAGGTLWVIGLVLAMITGGRVATDFASEAEETQVIALNFDSVSVDKPIVLALNHDLGENEPTEEFEVMGMELLVADGVLSIYGKPELDITQSTNGKTELVIRRKACGANLQEGNKRAKAIDYGFATTDTSLLLNGFFAIPDADKWRSQEVELELRLAVGATILLTEEMQNLIYDVKNVTNTYDSDMIGRRWVMTTDGLACVDCLGLEDRNTDEATDEYESEVDRVERNRDEMERRMEEKKRELEEMEREMEREMKLEMDQIKRDLKLKKENAKSADEQSDSESSTSPREILLKRVVKASYWIDPETFRSITMTALPG